jgi:hypothetical protein
LNHDQLEDKTLLPLERLAEVLAEVSAQKQIGMVDLYGGELGLLPKDYWNSLIELLHMYGIYDINLITNLSMVNDITTDERVYTSVSFDFNAREDHARVWRNMALLTKPFSILMLASPDLLMKDVEEMVMTLNALNNLECVEIKPYSKNQANQFSISYEQFEEFVKDWIRAPDKKFLLNNTALLDSVISKERNAFSDDHIYITPSGRYGVLEFDLNDNEFFQEYDTLDEYFAWCQKERDRVSRNKYCSGCEYFGNCLSEHLRNVTSLDESCNGFKNLIDWYKNGRLENKARDLSQNQPDSH